MHLIKELVKTLFDYNCDTNIVSIEFEKQLYNIPVYFDNIAIADSKLRPHFYTQNAEDILTFNPLAGQTITFKKGVHLPDIDIQILVNHYYIHEVNNYNYTLNLLKNNNVLTEAKNNQDILFVLFSILHEYAHYIDLLKNFNGNGNDYKKHYASDFAYRKVLCNRGLNGIDFQIEYNENLAFEKYANDVGIQILDNLEKSKIYKAINSYCPMQYQ